MMRKTRILAPLAAALIAASSVLAGETPTANTVLATVDGTEITVGHVIAFRGRLPQQYQDLPDRVLLDGIVDQLIQQTVLANAMKRQLDQRTKIGLENEKRSFLAGEMLSRASERAITEEEIQTAYQERYDSTVPDQEYETSHILVKTKEEAAEIVSLLEDGAEFTTLAKERSTGPSGPNGGSLGWLSKGDTVKPFEDTVLSMAVGEISAPVESRFGWHVIRLDDMRSKSIPSLEAIRPNLTLELQQRALENQVTRLSEGANIDRANTDIDPTIIRDASLFDD